MKKPLYQNNRGIAHLAVIVAVVVVVAVGAAGWYAYQNRDKDSKNESAADANSVVADSKIEKACKKVYGDDDLCKFSSRYTATGPYKATYANTDKNGKTSIMVMEVDSKNNSSVITKEGDTEVGAYISLNGDMYVKDMADGQWTKYPKSPDTPVSDNNPADNLKIDTKEDDKSEAERITYKKLGKEKCGNATCLKYQVIDPSKPTAESIIWFGDKDYQLHKWSFKDTEGNINIGEFVYTAVTIKAPSPVKAAPTVPSQADLQSLIDQTQAAQE